MRPFDDIVRIERAEILDKPAAAVRGVVTRVLTNRKVKDALHGVWLGHPLHPGLAAVAAGSFISATLLLPRLPEVAPGADVLVMVKPQFEVGRSQVGRGGVVRDDALRAAAADRVRSCAESLGYRLQGQVDSRVPGPKGNREIFLWLRPAPSLRPEPA